MEIATDYVHFGWLYRCNYEEQHQADNDIRVRFSLEHLPQAASWICLAIMSGIIGGASWDAVKVIISKIRVQNDDPEVSKIVDDEAILLRFRDYMLSYHRSFSDVNPKVRNAIIEEIMAHSSETTLVLDDIQNGAIPKHKLEAIIKKSRKRMRGKISNMIARQLWQGLK